MRQIVAETLQEAVSTVSHEAEIVSHEAEEALHHAGNHEPELCEIPDPTANGILLSTICEESVQPQETYYSMEDVSMGPILPLTLEELVIEDSTQQTTQGLPQVNTEKGLHQEDSVLKSDSDIRDSEVFNSEAICDNSAVSQATDMLPAEPVTSEEDPIASLAMALPTAVSVQGGARPKERPSVQDSESEQLVNNSVQQSWKKCGILGS